MLFRSVLRGWRPAADDGTRRGQTVTLHVVHNEFDGGTVAIHIGMKAAEAFHLRTLGIQAKPVIGGMVTNIERIVISHAQIDIISHGVSFRMRHDTRRLRRPCESFFLFT